MAVQQIGKEPHHGLASIRRQLSNRGRNFKENEGGGSVECAERRLPLISRTKVEERASQVSQSGAAEAKVKLSFPPFLAIWASVLDGLDCCFSCLRAH